MKVSLVSKNNFQSLNNDMGVADQLKSEVNATSVLVKPPVPQFMKRY